MSFDFVLATLMLAAWIWANLLIFTQRCSYRDEMCAWSCGLRDGHAGDHGLWVKDEIADALGLL